MHRPLPWLLVGALLGACQSKVTTTTDPTQQARVTALQDHFPGTYARLDTLVRALGTWDLTAGTDSVPDPTGLTWSEQGNGTVDVTYATGGLTFTITIRFYNATGTQQNLNLTGATTLNDVFARGSSQLAAGAFAVGAWSLSGGGFTGSGAFTGVYEGASSPVIQTIRTTSSTVAGGPPATAIGSITSTSGGTARLDFSTGGLTLPGANAYPSGTLVATLVAPTATITITAVFDGTPVITVAVTGIDGVFAYDVVGRTLTFLG